MGNKCVPCIGKSQAAYDHDQIKKKLENLQDIEEKGDD